MADKSIADQLKTLDLHEEIFQLLVSHVRTKDFRELMHDLAQDAMEGVEGQEIRWGRYLSLDHALGNALDDIRLRAELIEQQLPRRHA